LFTAITNVCFDDHAILELFDPAYEGKMTLVPQCSGYGFLCGRNDSL